ncbi:MAG: glycosyltransferase [Balneolales bacterium]
MMTACFFELLQGVTVVEWIPWILITIYVVMMLVLMIGLYRVSYSRYESSGKPMPSVSVIVSARNEERDLPGCIESLLRLNYPPGLLQIILVNDRSTDGTGAIMEETARQHPGITVLNTTESGASRLEGKARGIARGFQAATGEWVAITDADARANPDWLLHLLYDVDENVGMIGGSLVVEPSGLLGKAERMNWGFVQMFNVGITGYGKSIVCVGPNMAMRRSIYEQSGGLERAQFRIAEDLALHEMVKTNGYKIKNYMDEPTTITLRPVLSWNHLFSQTKRWLGGGMDNPDYAFLLILGFGAAFLFGLYLLFGWLLGLTAWLAVVLIKSLTDIAYFQLQAHRMKLNSYTIYFYIFAVAFAIIMVFLTLSFIYSRKITWKGSGYTITYD